MSKKAKDTGNSLHRGPVGKFWGGLFTENFERQMKEATETGNSLHRGPRWKILRGFFYREFWETCQRRLKKQATLSIGAPIGEFWGGLFTENFERQMKEAKETGNSLHRGPRWEILRGFVYREFWETCQRRLKKQATLSIGAPVGKFWGGLFTENFERHVKEG